MVPAFEAARRLNKKDGELVSAISHAQIRTISGRHQNPLSG